MNLDDAWKNWTVHVGVEDGAAPIEKARVWKADDGYWMIRMNTLHGVQTLSAFSWSSAVGVATGTIRIAGITA